MIEQSQSIYYISYAVIVAALVITYLKLKTSEGTVITTKEFQVFQSGFLSGYSMVILCELIAAASFYHTFISLHLTLEKITMLYITTITASTLAGVATEIVDVGTRKDKCVISAMLYSISMFSILFGGHYEMILLGRIVYGVASSLHHTSFESYAVHEHSSLGFPEDWLGHTFSLLTHCMALMAALSGILGQIAASTGQLGCPALCCALFAVSAAYMVITWEKDLNSPRFMLSSFIYNMNSTISAVRSNKQILLLLAISSLCEASMLVFTFYWAPWMSALASEEDERISYEVLFSCLIMASMLGNYFFQLFSSSALGGYGGTFQAVILCSSVSYFLGAVFQTPMLAFLISLVVHGCMGGYYPAVGFFRGKLMVPELRSTALIILRVSSLLLAVLLLATIHHNPMYLLGACSILNGVAAYLQNNYVSASSSSPSHPSIYLSLSSYKYPNYNTITITTDGPCNRSCGR